MRKVIYYVTASLDGFIADANGGVDWLTEPEGEDLGYHEFYESIDTVVQGRTTYEQVLTFGDYPYSSKENFVFSSTLDHAEHAQVVNGSVAEFVREQKARSGKDLWLVGGGRLAASFLEANALDRLIVFVQPILLGTGLPLVSHLGESVPLNLVATRSYGNQLARLDYDVTHSTTQR